MEFIAHAWNWELEGWPHFDWQPERLRIREKVFIENAVIAVGTMRHLEKDDHAEIVIELLSSDALSTSAIEGGEFSIVIASSRLCDANSECRRHLFAAGRRRQALPK